MSISNTLRQAADFYDMAVRLLEEISKLTASTKDDKAVEILKAVSVAVNTALAGFNGKITLKAVHKELDKLKTHIAKNDEKADKLVHDRFDTSETK